MQDFNKNSHGVTIDVSSSLQLLEVNINLNPPFGCENLNPLVLKFDTPESMGLYIS